MSDSSAPFSPRQNRGLTTDYQAVFVTSKPPQINAYRGMEALGWQVGHQ